MLFHRNFLEIITVFLPSNLSHTCEDVLIVNLSQIVALAAVVSYAATGNPGPAVFAFISAVVSFLITADIWMFHRTGYEAMHNPYKKQRLVVLKMFFALFILVS